MYGDKSQNAYLEKSALETAVIHGGTNCDTLPDDDPNFKPCECGWGECMNAPYFGKDCDPPDQCPEIIKYSQMNFMKVSNLSK